MPIKPNSVCGKSDDSNTAGTFFAEFFMDDIKKHSTFSRRLVLVYTCIVAAPLFILAVCIVNIVSHRQLKALSNSCAAKTDEHTEYIRKNTKSFSLLERMINGNSTLMLFFALPERNDENEIINTIVAEGTTIERTLAVMPEIYALRVFADNPHIPERWPIFLSSSRTDLSSLNTWEFNYKADYLGNLDQMKSESVCTTRRIIKNRQPVGYIQITMKMSDFFPFLYKNVDENEHDYIFKTVQDDFNAQLRLIPVTNENIQAFHGTFDEKDIHTLAEEINAARDMRTGRIKLSQNGTVRFVSWSYTEDIGLVCVHTSSTKSITRNLIIIELLAGGGFILTIVALYFLVRFTTAHLMSGVYSIMGGMEKVKAGDLGVCIPVDNKDEVGEAQKTFNTMTMQLREQICQITHEQQLIADTEMKAMQNQINAHFLYNVLETIKMQAVIANEEDIAESLAVLGKLMRYGLRWRVHIVTLAQEIEYIRSYIYLLNIRNDYIISLQTEIPSEFLNIEIPKMILQPLVENSFVHGIEKAGKDSVVRVFARCDTENPNTLWLCVQDFCGGINTEELKRINEYLNDDTYERDTTGHIGLKNIQQRLHILYGKEYRIRIVSEVGKGTLVRIPIPLNHIRKARESTAAYDGSTGAYA